MISYSDSRHSSNKWTLALWYALATVLIYIMFISSLLPLAGGHPWGLLGFGRHFAIDCYDQVPERFVRSESGYDGQMYFVLALSPLVRDSATLGFHLDNQALRQQRILYPFVTYLLAGGNSACTAWFMFIINVFTAGMIVFIAARILDHMRQPIWLSLLIGLYPGFVISISRGLTEPLCVLWILSAILMWRQRPILAGVMLGLAVLTRETALLVAVGFGCAWLLKMIKGASRGPSIWIWIIPLSVYLLWNGFLMLWIIDSSSIGAAASANIGWPLTGLFESLVKNATFQPLKHLLFLFFILIIIVWQCFTAKVSNPGYNPLFLGWVLYGILLSLTGIGIWDNSPGLLRVATELNILAFLLVAASGYSRWKPVAVMWMGAWSLSAFGEYFRYGLMN